MVTFIFTGHKSGLQGKSLRVFGPSIHPDLLPTRTLFLLVPALASNTGIELKDRGMGLSNMEMIVCLDWPVFFFPET